jgi:hypothetical protein
MNRLMRRLVFWRWGRGGSGGGGGGSGSVDNALWDGANTLWDGANNLSTNTDALPPELLAFTVSGMPYSRRSAPRTFAMPDGTPVAIGNMADLAVEADLFLNPHNRLSAHHRPIGRGAIAGVPGGCATIGGAYDSPGAVNSRGRIANVKYFILGNTNQAKKYTYKVDSGDSTDRTIADEVGAPSNNKLPFTCRFPNGVTLPSTSGDDVIQLWPRDGGGTDISDLFFNFEDADSTARRRYEFPIGGLDFVDGSDIYDRGSSASYLRYPGTILRGSEINPTNPAPIRHALHCTATGNDNQGAPEGAHVVAPKMVWPAYGMDSSAGTPGNTLGDIPYGARLFIRWQDRGRRATLGLSARGLVLFDCFAQYGCYILDTVGDHEDGQGYMKLRVDQDIQTSGSIADDINAQLALILPLLYPLRNPCSHADHESEVWADGYAYAGGDGPIDASSINTAWDR